MSVIDPAHELPPISAYLTDFEPSKANGVRGKTETETVPQSHYLPWSVLSQREPPPRRWFMSEWLTTGATILAGRGGTGKTTLAQTMASAGATQTTYITSIEKIIVNFMWACEDDHDELWRRQIQICSALGIEMTALEDLFYLESRLGCDNTLFAPVMGRMQWTPAFELLKEEVNDVGADVLWLDNIGQTFGGNENERHPVTAFVNGLMGLRPGIAVVLLGHPARNSGSEYAGSAAWENAVRSRWYFGDRLPDQPDEQEPEEDVRYLCRRKANYSFRDYARLRYRNGVFMPEQPDGLSFAERFGGQNRQESLDTIVLAGFDKCVAAGIAVTDGRTSPDYLPTRLVDMGLNAGRSKRDIAATMNRLMADGRFKRVQVGSYTNRNPKMGLVRQ